MREVDSSETSVVWPAWCYSGETVNEDLPQATTPASLLHEHQHHQQQQQQQRFLLQQSSSNQSQSSPSSSSASSSPSSHLVPGQGAGKLSTVRRRRRHSRSSSGGGKRKSITSTTPPGPRTPALATASAALEVQCSVSAALATAAAAAAAAAFQASPRRSNPPTPTTSSGLQLALVSENGNGCRGSPLSNPSTTPTHDDGGHYSPLNNNTISSSNFNSQDAALQSLNKMLSERMYDRKKFLNSPTAGQAAAAVAAAAAASSFYEKLRNGAAEMELSQLNLIKNGQSPLAASDLSAIGSNNGNSGGGSANGAGTGLLVTANGTSSGSSSGALGADGNSGNSLSNSNNQNSGSGNNASSGSSSSTGSIGNNSNNNSIKSERFSPTNNDVQSTASRSRSVTPSSFSGTPPQTMHATEVAFPSSISTSGLLPSPNSAASMVAGGGRHEFQARNYSDIMRSLAAKYHNNNNSPGPNGGSDQSSVKNPFLEPKMRINQPKSFTDGPLLGSKKSSPITSTQVPNASIMSSLFPGLPFQSSVFPPLIDMSSTQALVALARAAKESGIHNLLKPEDGGLKKPAAGSRSSSPPMGATSLASHFPSPFPPRYLPGILPNHHHHHHLSASYPTTVQSTTTAVPAISPLKSPTRPTEGLSTFPLDLSSAAGAPPAAKRIKLSPTPSRNQETSPAPSSTNSQPSDSMELKLGLPRKCHARIEEISAWTVDNVCDFVGSIDICAEYVQVSGIDCFCFI
nr:phosphatidylinositol 3-kinase 2-like [Aedes albopictus]